MRCVYIVNGDRRTETFEVECVGSEVAFTMRSDEDAIVFRHLSAREAEDLVAALTAAIAEARS